MAICANTHVFSINIQYGSQQIYNTVVILYVGWFRGNTADGTNGFFSAPHRLLQQVSRRVPDTITIPFFIRTRRTHPFQSASQSLIGSLTLELSIQHHVKGEVELPARDFFFPNLARQAD